MHPNNKRKLDRACKKLDLLRQQIIKLAAQEKQHAAEVINLLQAEGEKSHLFGERKATLKQPVTRSLTPSKFRSRCQKPRRCSRRT